jgi:hypothetical protein
MAEFNLAANPAAQSCRLIDFKAAKVIPGFFPNTFFLIVSGEKPCINMTVSLVPLVYVKCPDYWEIEVVGCLPHGICLPATGPYSVAIPLAGITGSAGIEVVGASTRKKIKVKGGCKPVTASA